jgi:hypothetical protein
MEKREMVLHHFHNKSKGGYDLDGNARGRHPKCEAEAHEKARDGNGYHGNSGHKGSKDQHRGVQIGFKVELLHREQRQEDHQGGGHHKAGHSRHQRRSGRQPRKEVIRWRLRIRTSKS